MKPKQIQPAQYCPTSPDEFIGPARELARIFATKAKTLMADRTASLKYVLTGTPGIGKTKLAEFLASQLTGETIRNGQSFNVESVNGRNVNLNLVRKWQEQARYMATGWSVKIVNELDTMSMESQDLTLTYLDELPTRTAIIGTSNLKITDLHERFQTRLQQFNVKAPDEKALTALLTKFGLNKMTISQIVVGCGTNVRAALLDTQSILDAKLA